MDDVFARAFARLPAGMDDVAAPALAVCGPDAAPDAAGDRADVVRPLEDFAKAFDDLAVGPGSKRKHFKRPVWTGDERRGRKKWSGCHLWPRAVVVRSGKRLERRSSCQWRSS